MSTVGEQLDASGWIWDAATVPEIPPSKLKLEFSNTIQGRKIKDVSFHYII